MLLSLVGIPTTRVQALGLFALRRSNPSYGGASDLEIGSAFASVARVRRWRWQYQKRFHFASVSQCLRAQLQNNDYPTLLSFGAIHKNGDWRCLHVVVAISATDESIEVLDPLGSRPVGHSGNVWFQRDKRPKRVRVIGSSYSINLTHETGVLRWIASEDSSGDSH